MQILYKPYKILDEKPYLALVTFLIPMLNFLNGILVDMYTPSMPAIATDLHASMVLIKNTITATIFGYAIGAAVLGAIFDIFGRRIITVIAIILFIITSLFATLCHDINSLIIIRFFQGVLGSVMAIGSRVIASDHFKDKKLTVVILYASLAFGIGTVIAPFIGGYLQYHFGWHANFYVFIIFSILIFIPFLLFIQERFHRAETYNYKKLISSYHDLFSRKNFVAGLGILAIVQFELLLFPTIGSFIIEHNLNYSPIVFGQSAFIVGLGYLAGVFTNRMLLQIKPQQNLVELGLKIAAMSTILELCLAVFFHMTLWSLIIPIAILCYSGGFLMGNVSSVLIQTFSENASIVASTNMSSMMLLSAFACFIISHIETNSLFTLFIIFLILILLKRTFYFKYFKPLFRG